MKIVRILLIAAFALSLCLSAAPARAAGPSTGFVALVTQAKPNMPLAAQARMEFNRLAPALLAAKQSGYLLDFQPEFRAGILKLRFSGTSVAPMSVAGMMQRPVYGSIHEAAAAVPHQRIPAERVSAAVTGSQFYVNLFGSCFEGFGLPLNAHIIVTLKDGAGNLKAKYEGNEQDDGFADNYLFECFNWSGYNTIVPGWKVIFKVYDTYPGGTLLETYAPTVPTVKFTSITKSSAVVAGTGPANKAYEIYFWQPVLNAAGDWVANGFADVISGAGTWSDDVYSGSMRGGSWIEVDVHQAPNVTFIRGMQAPYINCQLGGNFCSITGFAFQTSQLKVIHSGTTYTFNGKFDAWGWFGASVENSSGAPVIIKAGDKVLGTNVAQYTLHTLVINAFDFTNDIVSGKAPASKFFDVWVQSYSSLDWVEYWTGSDGSGNFSVDTTGDIDLLSTETSEAEIYFQDKPTGNVTDLTRVYGP